MATMEELLKNIEQLMKKNGTNQTQFVFNSKVIKITLSDQTAKQNNFTKDILSNNPSSGSELTIEKTSSNYQNILQGSLSSIPSEKIKQNKIQSLKKISLFNSNENIENEMIAAPNSHVQNLFDDDDEINDYKILPRQQQLQKSNDQRSFFNNFLQSNDQIRTYFNNEQLKIQEIKKKELQLSNIISESLNSSQNFYELSSFISIATSKDPLCRLVSAYFKNLHDISMVKNTETPAFLFLYSQPLIKYSIQGKKIPIQMQIDYEKEEENIKEILKDCKIGYIRQCATTQRLINRLQTGIQFIHFCGHGISTQNNSNRLIFQDNQGGAAQITCEEISQILKNLKKALQFVFVASCHSKQLGQVFLKAGSPHVICVRSQQKILDQACKYFVKQFYIACINLGKTICKSFQHAKLQLSLKNFPKGQQNKFVLLKYQNLLDEHQCTTLSSVQCGEFKDLTQKPIYYKSIPSKIENFIVRHQIMHQIIQSLKSNRFITIKGIPGIGKSTLIRELCRFLNYRSFFKDGILYTRIVNYENVEMILNNIIFEIFQGRSIISTKSRYQESTLKIVKQLRDKNILIILDDCDCIYNSNDKLKFKEFIETILRQCHRVHFMFTNRTRIGQIMYNYQFDHCSERVFNIQKLDLEDSKKLFLSKSPRILQEIQIQQFLKKQKVFDIKKHPLFQFLNGHPQAISLSAAMLQSNTLHQVYQLLTKQSMTKQYILNAEQKRGYNPFRISLEVSWNIIKKKYKQAALMFKIMGMLPAGLDIQTMSRIFGSSWRQQIKILKQYSLIKQSQRLNNLIYYSIYPFMLVYAESLLEPEQKKKYHEKLTQQLSKRLFQKIYKNIGTLSHLSQKSIELYLVQEINYKVCIYREFELMGQPNKIKTIYSNLFQKDTEIYSEDQNSQNSRTDKKSNTDENSLISSCSSTSKFLGQNITKRYKIQDVHSENQDNNKIDDRKKLIRSKQKSPQNQKQKTFKSTKIKKDPPNILRLILFQATILFVMKNFTSCQKVIYYGKQLSDKLKSPISQANLIRIMGCIALVKKNEADAKDFFLKSLQQFAKIGCGLGTASCQSAIGYIRFMEQQYAQAKKYLQSALKYYQQIPHIFGKHYLNRWLYNIKTKINRAQNELFIHNEEAKKLIKQAKIALKGNKLEHFLIKHKAGLFVFRYMFDNISLFLQCSFEIDIKPKKIQPINKEINVLKNLGPITSQIKKQTLQNDLLTIIEDIEEKSFIGQIQEKGNLVYQVDQKNLYIEFNEKNKLKKQENNTSRNNLIVKKNTSVILEKKERKQSIVSKQLGKQKEIKQTKQSTKQILNTKTIFKPNTVSFVSNKQQVQKKK